MSRKDWVWVAIKVFGIYLGVEAVRAVPPLVTNYLTLNEVHDAQLSVGHVMMMPIWGQFAALVILANLSLYFLRSGRLVFWLIGPWIPSE
jgi:hypothetical protein